jgi:hypothetical protein
MRTDIVKVPALLFAAALLGSGLPAAAQGAATEELRRESAAAQAEVAREVAAAQTETAREAARTHREAVREAVRARAQVREAGVSVLTGDHVVADGEVIDGDMVVVGGDLTVHGEIRGNAVVTGGDLLMEEGGRVMGDAVVTDGELLNHGGRILGEMRTLGGNEEHVLVMPSAPHAPPPPQAVRVRHPSWFDDIGEGIAGVMSTLAFALVLAGIAAALVFYGLPYLRKVSDTVRLHTGRSAAVGLASLILIVPAGVLLFVALTVSIVGIPLLLLAVPLYPVAALAALVLGGLAVAHAIGEYTAEQRGGFDFRYRNAYAYAFFGIGLLLAPMLAGHLIGMVGFLDWLAVLLMVVGVMVLLAAATLGLGAVILTRAGTREAYVPRGYDPVLDGDPIFDAEPVAREPHV